MRRTRQSWKLAMIPVVAAAFLSAGCGNGEIAANPEEGAKLKQARINAYGPSGTTPTNKNASAGSSALTPEAAARQKAMRGGR